MHEVLVNRLGGLSLPRKSVVRLTDRPDMTLDVYRGRKTTKQQYLCVKMYMYSPSKQPCQPHTTTSSVYIYRNQSYHLAVFTTEGRLGDLCLSNCLSVYLLRCNMYHLLLQLHITISSIYIETRGRLFKASLA